MSPKQAKTLIREEYARMLERADRGEINHSAIWPIVEASAREAARHSGVPEYWRNYLPTQVTEP